MLSRCQKHSPLDGDPVSVKRNEGKGRKAISTVGSPYLPHDHELFRGSWAMVEKWPSLEGIVQVC